MLPIIKIEKNISAEYRRIKDETKKVGGKVDFQDIVKKEVIAALCPEEQVEAVSGAILKNFAKRNAEWRSARKKQYHLKAS